MLAVVSCNLLIVTFKIEENHWQYWVGWVCLWESVYLDVYCKTCLSVSTKCFALFTYWEVKV